MDYDKYTVPYIKGDPDYRNKVRAAENAFKIDALTELEILDHPKAEMAFNLACEYGGSVGYSEIFLYLDDLADLLK